MLLYKLYNGGELKMKDGIPLTQEEINEQYPFTTNDLGCYGYTVVRNDELVFTIENVADIKANNSSIEATEPQAIIDEYMALLRYNESMAYENAVKNNKMYDLLSQAQADGAYTAMISEMTYKEIVIKEANEL